MNVKTWNKKTIDEEIGRRLNLKIEECATPPNKTLITALKKICQAEFEKDAKELEKLEKRRERDRINYRNLNKRLEKKKQEAQDIINAREREIKRCKHCQATLCELDGDNMQSEYCIRHI